MREVFAQGLREHGYVAGKNVILDERFAEAGTDRLPEAIRNLLSRKPDVLVVAGSQAINAAKAATTTVPIVMVSVADPVGQGLVASLARPGGNITGNAILAEVLVTKRLELLWEVIPKAKRVAYVANPTNQSTPAVVSQLRAAARALGIDIVLFNASTIDELEEVLKDAARQRVDALMINQDVMSFIFRKRIAESISRIRIPAMHGFSETVVEGGLISYSASTLEFYRNAAKFASRILKGAKPGDLPIELPTKMEMFVNLKTAKALGIAIPQSVLLRADRVIE